MPGINGPTSLSAIRNADDDLARVRSTPEDLGLLDTTDIIGTADHGFSTISKESRTSSTIKTKFADTLPDHLPYGFVALDLARALNLPLIDPDDGYRTIASNGQHTKNGNGLIGDDRNKPKVVVAANGGSDLIYIPDGDKAMAKRIVDALLTQDYVSGIFVDFQAWQNFPALCRWTTSRSKARRSRRTRRSRSVPVIRHRVRRTGAMHGRSRRHDPSARPGHARFVQPRRHLELHGDAGTGLQIALHRSGTDEQRRSRPTIAHLMQLDVNDNGKLVGRVLSEALPGGALPDVTSRVIASDPAANGLVTVLNMQTVGTTRYFDAAGFPGRTVGLSTTVLPRPTTQ